MAGKGSIERHDGDLWLVFDQQLADEIGIAEGDEVSINRRGEIRLTGRAKSELDPGSSPG